MTGRGVFESFFARLLAINVLHDMIRPGYRSIDPYHREISWNTISLLNTTGKVSVERYQPTPYKTSDRGQAVSFHDHGLGYYSVQ